MDDEAMKMARRIVKATLRPDRHERCNCREEIDRGAWDNGHPMKAALAAIIETREWAAALADELTDAANSMVRVYDYSDKSRVVTLLRKAAAAIRSGQQFRKDV